jgi:hypothetical protein
MKATVMPRRLLFGAMMRKGIKVEPHLLQRHAGVPRWSHQEKARDLDLAGSDRFPDQLRSDRSRPVSASNMTPIVDPQEGQPEKSPGRATLLEEMSWRCPDHLDVSRFLALSEDGDVALFERRGSNAEWLSIGVTSISENKCWHFGWNSRRVSSCYDTHDLQHHHPEIFAWAVQELATIYDLRAYRRNWHTARTTRSISRSPRLTASRERQARRSSPSVRRWRERWGRTRQDNGMRAFGAR